jgi:3-phosphoshikimate 1-carboxyvinyltransferase
MKREIKPARKLGGTISVPGDKSIGHRAALLSIISKGPLTVRNLPNGADVLSSLNAAKRFGVQVEEQDGALVLTPPSSPQIDPETIVDCGNSGTTARLLAGLIAGSNLSVVLSGDESLSRRPMRRVVDPLTAMGAELFATDGHLPMKINGRKLLPFEYRMPVASAQVKSALLLAGLTSSCTVTIREDSITRDHTELMIQAIGEGITIREIKAVLMPDPDDPRKKRSVMPETFKKEIILTGQARINGGLVDIPGDISTAAFFFGAAAITGDTVTVTNCGLNPTRTEFLDYLRATGCQVTITDKVTLSGEPRGTVSVTGGSLKGKKIAGETTVGLIDEIPMVAVMAAFSEGTTIIRDAGELRVKESDRLAAISENLTRMGVKCGLLDDGLAIEGRQEINGADLVSYGDHRIAMAFSIASLAAVGPSTMDDTSCVGISCPEFYDLLLRIIA